MRNRVAGWAAAISAAGVLAALSTLAYLWIIWGDRGLYADVTGTAGYSSATEWALLIGSLATIPILGIVAITSLVF